MKMKRLYSMLAAALCAALILSSCGSAGNPSSEAKSSEQESSAAEASKTTTEPIFSSADEYPRVDGSTANLPLMARVMQDTCGISAEEAENLTQNTGTNASWNRLVNNEVDLLLVYEAPKETQEEIKKLGVELEVTAVGRDALVFLVNSGNSLDGLTQDQLRDIYTGKVTNWKELGGKDQKIFPFQRNATSGSQTMFLKLLMGDITPMDPPEQLISGAMGQLIDSVASYDNSDGAIGYSVYYYAAMMYENPDLKLLAVDGVEPSNESIADGSYPLLNEFYLAIRADEPEDSPTRKLYNWILSDAGRTAFEESNYVPIF